MKSYHYCNIESSKRLQDTLEYIISHPLCSNWDIMKSTGSTRAACDVNEINHNFKDKCINLKIIVVKCIRKGKKLNTWYITTAVGWDDNSIHDAKYMLKLWKRNLDKLKNVAYS